MRFPSNFGTPVCYYVHWSEERLNERSGKILSRLLDLTFFKNQFLLAFFQCLSYVCSLFIFFFESGFLRHCQRDMVSLDTAQNVCKFKTLESQLDEGNIDKRKIYPTSNDIKSPYYQKPKVKLGTVKLQRNLSYCKLFSSLPPELFTVKNG